MDDCVRHRFSLLPERFVLGYCIECAKYYCQLCGFVTEEYDLLPNNIIYNRILDAFRKHTCNNSVKLKNNMYCINCQDSENNKYKWLTLKIGMCYHKLLKML